MSNSTHSSRYDTLLKNAIIEIEKKNAEIQSLKSTQHEPIAIIGMACRFPGCNNLDSFWELLKEGLEAPLEMTKERWAMSSYYSDLNQKGKIHCKKVGLIDYVDQFDAQFFGISPREMASLDPSQRILLEISYEAIEHSNYTLTTLRNNKVGIFIGIMGSDYLTLYREYDQLKTDAYLGTGNAHSTAAGRISYILGINGPSVAVDTACSSSLVGVHLACQSLRQGDCSMALAGGVNLILHPDISLITSNADMLSKRGVCSAFDAKADGYVRSEGCGIVVLKKLTEAARDNDTIYGTIKGSSINQDGKTSGLTVPNERAQILLIKEALERASVLPSEIDYIESHGSGTPLGDPIEVAALSAVFSEKGTDAQKKLDDRQNLKIGSVKSNLGHMEAAAGIGGLIKILLALKYECLPKHLHFKEPNPYIPWESNGVTVIDKPIDWKASSNRKRIAGISSFGFSGTNVHMIIAERPQSTNTFITSQGEPRSTLFLKLSAQSKKTLFQLAKNYAESLLKETASVEDFCYTACVYRNDFHYCVGLVADNKQSLIQQLIGLDDEEQNNSIKGISQTMKIAWVFGKLPINDATLAHFKILYQTCSGFKMAIDECDKLFKVHQHDFLVSNLENNRFTGSSSKLNEDLLSFCLKYAYAKMWFEFGLEVAILVDGNMGEIILAVLSKIISLKDAIELMVRRKQRNLISVVLEKSFSLATMGCFSLSSEKRVEHELTNPNYWLKILSSNDNAAEINNNTFDALKELAISHAFILGDLDLREGTVGNEINLVHCLSGENPLLSFYRILALVYSYKPMMNLQFNWEKIFNEGSHNKISIPMYPWNRKCYWLNPFVLSKPNFSNINSKKLSEQLRESSNTQIAYNISRGKTTEVNLDIIHKLDQRLSDRSLDFAKVELTNFQSLNQLGAESILMIFRNFGVFLNMEESFSVSDIMERLQVIQKHFRLISCILEILLDHKLIVQKGEFYSLSVELNCSKINAKDLENDKEYLYRSYPELRPYITFLWECFKVYSEMLQGKVSPMEVLFPEGPLALTKGIDAGTPIVDFYNELVSDLVLEFTSDRLKLNLDVINILEIGAGTGDASYFILKKLANIQGSIRYLYTDISNGFLKSARRRFENIFKGVSYHCLDVEKNPKSQGFVASSADLILASNALHATTNINKTLRHVKQLLKPHGILILNELNHRSDFITLTFGLTDGWWLIEDSENRIPYSPILNRSQWESILQRNGFRFVKIGKEIADMESMSGRLIIVAESDGEIDEDKLFRISVPCYPLERPNDDLSVDQSHLLLNNMEMFEANRLVEATDQTDIVLTLPVVKSKEDLLLYITLLLAKTVKINIHDINLDVSMLFHGLDSLMAMEIKKQIELDLKLNISLVELLEDSSITEFCNLLYARFDTLNSTILETKNRSEQDEEEKIVELFF